jgi:pimeloyl-ACP methyl ester carboxylesterase
VEDWRQGYQRKQESPWFVEDQTDIEHLVTSVTHPTLLIFGEADRIAPPAVGRHLASLFSDARLVVIPDGGHDAPIEHADEVAGYIRDFLEAP